LQLILKKTKMSYLFTSESVSEGHPDKVADQISDAVLDAFLNYDPQAKVACETFVTTGLVVIGGEIKCNTEAKAKVDVQEIARNVIDKIGYNKSEYQFDFKSCGILNALHEQSADINQGVDRGKPEEQGAGDQGMMFGYASNETDNFMPLPLAISHLLLQELAAIRKEGKVMKYLRPDAKSQVTIRYSDKGRPEAIDTIVISTQHDEFVGGGEKSSQMAMQEKITADIHKYLIPRVKKGMNAKNRRLFNDSIKYHINPTGNFVIGGPHGDTGLTGRKIIVDTFGGKGAHGGGAFSGKDPSKVDRSAAYACRHIAKNLVAAGVCSEILVQVSYAIGVVEPMGIYVNTYRTSKVKMNDGEIAEKVSKIFDMRPGMIEKRLKLRNPMYLETAAYGHMGRNNEIIKKQAVCTDPQTKEVELFTWEKLDFVDQVKKEFGL
jgi:S-adenosylmethionine synthetase